MEQNQLAPCLPRMKDCSDTETLSQHPIITPLEDKVLGLRSWPCYRSKGSYDQDSILKSRDITLPTKFCLVKAMVFPVVMWELDYKESWVLKSWCFWTVVLEKTLESPLDGKAIQPVHPKGNQSWVFIGRTDAEAETPILWPPEE